MHRLTALVLVLPALALLSGDARRHVHAYTDHEHRAHQHGIAAHDHHDDDAQPEGVHVDACDPGQHTIRISIVGCETIHVGAIQAIVPIAPVIGRAPSTSANVAVTDVRVHGPPAHAHLPLRAPPQTSA